MKPRRVPKIRVSPLARKCAAAAGVDLKTVKGTGPRGRIVAKDIARGAKQEPAAFDDFTPEEWAEVQRARAALPALPPDVGGFLECQRLTAADLNITVR